MQKKKNLLSKFTILGAVGAIVYVIHVVFGGFLWEGYNHLNQPISDLTATGAPDKFLLSIITLIYGLCSIAFCIFTYLYLKGSITKLAKIGILTFLAMHLVSITYGLFPQDLPGAPVTFIGTMHLVVTALIVPLTILSPILIGIGLKGIQEYRKFSIYSIITGAVIFIAGGTTAIFFANKLPYFGLIERINIGTLQIWMFIFSLKIFISSLDNVDASSKKLTTMNNLEKTLFGK